MTNEMLKICINQGYVPSDCKLDGMLVFLLVGDGKNPCDGCNANCVHRTCKCKNNYTNKEEIDKQERAIKRKRISANTQPVIFVDTDRDFITITAMIPNDERGYVAHFKSPQEAAWFIPIICGKYNARQVFIEVNGFGIAVYDHLLSNGEKLDNIDVIPMRCTSMRL